MTQFELMLEILIGNLSKYLAENLPNLFMGENPPTVNTSVAAKVLYQEVFYCVSGIINYDLDPSV